MMKKLIIVVLYAVLGAFCEEISKELQEKLKEAYCEAQCLDKIIQNATCSTTSKCNCSTALLENKSDFSKTSGIGLLSQPVLLCKTEHILSFKWERKQPLIYLLEYRSGNSAWKYVKKTCDSTILMDKLNSNTYYQVRLWAISPKGDIFGPRNSTKIMTNPVGYTPNPVAQINVDQKLRGQNYTAVVTWKPAEDRACFYDFMWVEADGELDFRQQEVRNIKDLFQIEIPNLKYNMNYIVEAVSKSGDMRRESIKTTATFVTPTCLEIYKTLNKCAPPMPQLLHVEEKLSKNANLKNLRYDIIVNWSKSNLLPDNYTVSIFVLMPNASVITQTVAGNQTNTTIYNKHLGVHYQVGLLASSKGGNSSMDLIDKQINISSHVFSPPPLWSDSTHIPIILGSIGGVVILALIIFIILYRRCTFKMAKRQQSDSMISKYYSEGFNEKCPPSLTNMTMEYYIPEIVNDEWQLDPDQVVLDELLGEGAFGVVHKGYMKKNNGNEMEVAIKMLRGNPTVEEIKQFEREIEIMKSVGSHPHLISLKGCCSKMGYFGPFLVVEYCAKGDLQTYLRAVWDQLSFQTPEMRYVNTPTLPEDVKTENHFSNKVYELFDDSLLEPRDLLSFARQIVLGMEHLSKLRVVHRDLAARNVLMCSNRTVKVADFGLSRDVYQDNIYTKTGSGKLPVKWMALESLSHQQYTTQSDIWSFGIVLWEIVTLGGHPYSAISAKDLLSLLKIGYRMECPKNCSEELYEIMTECWKELPKERPTFSDLRKMLEKLLENENRYVSLDVRY